MRELAVAIPKLIRETGYIKLFGGLIVCCIATAIFTYSYYIVLKFIIEGSVDHVVEVYARSKNWYDFYIGPI